MIALALLAFVMCGCASKQESIISGTWEVVDIQADDSGWGISLDLIYEVVEEKYEGRFEFRPGTTFMRLEESSEPVEGCYYFNQTQEMIRMITMDEAMELKVLSVSESRMQWQEKGDFHEATITLAKLN